MIRRTKPTKTLSRKKRGAKSVPYASANAAARPGGGLLSGDSIQAQATRLGDASQRVQRQELASEIGQTQGNRHLQSVISAVNGTVQRDPTVPTPVKDPIVMQLGRLEIRIETYAQLLAWSRAGISQLRDDVQGLDGTASERTRASEWIERIQAWQPYLKSQGDQPLGEFANSEAHTFLDEFLDIQHSIEESKQAVIRQELWRTEKQAEAAAVEVAALKPKLDDGLRAAYRTGEESAIKKAADVIGTSLDIGMGIRELSRMIAEKAAEHLETELGEAGKLTKGLEKINKGLAILNIAIILTDKERKVTEIEQGMKEITDASGIFAGLATLGNLAPHIGLYANLYIVPMCKAIMAQISELVNDLHEENVQWVEFSGDLFYPEAEPGGQAMFDFMILVMHATGADQVPPITDSIKEYLYDHREPLETGVRTPHESEEGAEVPTTGHWFWRKLDTDEARVWIYTHRERVWALFYGSMKVPEKKQPGKKDSP